MVEPVSDADLLRLMSEVISLREQVAQAELQADGLKRASLIPALILPKRSRPQKAR